MSIHVMSSVWKNSRQKANKLLMLLAIADNANDDGWAYPSVQTLAEKVRVSKRNAQKILDSLEAEKEIVIWNCKASKKTLLHSSNAYHLPKYGVEDAQPPTELRRYHMTMRSNVARDTTNGVMSLATLGNVARDTRVMSPETSESSFNHQLTNKDSAAPKIDATVGAQSTIKKNLTVEAQPTIATPSEQNNGVSDSHAPEKAKAKNPPNSAPPPKLRERDIVFDAISECGYKIKPGTKVTKKAGGHIAALQKEFTEAFNVHYGRIEPEKLANAIRIFYKQKYEDEGISPLIDVTKINLRFSAFLQNYKKQPVNGKHAPIEPPKVIEITDEQRAENLRHLQEAKRAVNQPKKDIA